MITKMSLKLVHNLMLRQKMSMGSIMNQLVLTFFKDVDYHILLAIIIIIAAT